MAIYHLEAKMVSRGAGRSAVAAAAYLSCSRLLNEYDGVQHDYTRKQGLGWRQVFLPATAPAEWQDREILWNAVEETETAKDSRLAREFVAALPIELSREEQIQLLQDFIKEQFVADGMCADAAIHDPYPPGHNPHAHILLTVRPLDEKGKWQYKTEKEYLCVKDSEERGFTAAEFKQAQGDGWEKQYQYKVGKKKVYMTPSAAQAQGYERVSKYPKSTKYGRQNPISERWNSEEQLVFWRKAWADVTNLHLERAGQEERIDHRSHAERGLEEQPTIHEGVIARALEKKGIVSDRCELNRQIKADNALLRELKAQMKKMAQAVKNSLPAIAEAMETLRANMIVFRYQLRHISRGKYKLSQYLDAAKPTFAEYLALVQKIKTAAKERKTMLTEKKEISFWNASKHKELSAKIAKLTEDIEELKSEKAVLLNQLDYADDSGIAAIKKDIADAEASLSKLEQQEKKYSAQLEAALNEYTNLKVRGADFDAAELYAQRMILRADIMAAAVDHVQAAYGEKYDSVMMFNSKRDVSALLHDEDKCRAYEQKSSQKKQQEHGSEQKEKYKHPEQER
ncbi:MobQ family relaxase [Allofournierella sp. CML151]|uniref:MobQ family relaxase n=1 Tax=Allofournierella sp. CML151 TaxID=2998082 RepID=UPI0022EB818C|nr:MobQ family relaxase [Fournierella sp. CML151]